MISKIFVITLKDMKNWFRQPFLILIAIAPIFIISTFLGLFLTKAEILPAGVVLNDDDPVAIELNDYLIAMKSGTGSPWFEMQSGGPEKIKDLFQEGKILTYIEIPEQLSERLHDNETVDIKVHINNINDDVTKNVLQRVQLACNHINRNITPQVTSLAIPHVRFLPLTKPDLTFTFYIMASTLALTVLMAGGVNMVTATAREFEQGTYIELIMAPPFAALILGKMFTTIVQTIIIFAIMVGESYFLFGFFPKANFAIVFLMFLLGVLCFSGLGFLLSCLIKKTIGAAIALLLINIIGWWVGGGLVPAEIWTGFIGFCSKIWPGTYFYESFISLVLLGQADTFILLRGVLISALFGLVTFIVALRLFHKGALVK
jgi:hypothetical protein